MTRPIVLFVEDPGAVNCIAPVAAALVERGTPSRVYATGPATALLAERGIAAADLPAHVAAIVTAAGAVLVGTSENVRTRAFDLVAAARAAGVPSAALIDSPANSAYRFRGETDDPLAHAPDWLWCPDDANAAEFVALGAEPSRVEVVGHPNDDRLAARATELAGIDRNALRRELFGAGARRFVIAFVSEISNGLEPMQYRRQPDYTLTGRGGRDLRTEIVVEELLDAVNVLACPRPYLILRRHPKETAADLAGLADEFNIVSTGGDPHALIVAADLVVGMTTMLLAEAQLLGTPTLAILPRLSERAWLAPLRDGRIPAVADRAALRAALSDLLGGTVGRKHCMMKHEPAVPRILALIDRIAP